MLTLLFYLEHKKFEQVIQAHLFGSKSHYNGFIYLFFFLGEQVRQRKKYNLALFTLYTSYD